MAKAKSRRSPKRGPLAKRSNCLGEDHISEEEREGLAEATRIGRRNIAAVIRAHRRVQKPKEK